MKKILVTGNLGFIGKNLSNSLSEYGHAVIGLESDILENKNWPEITLNFLEEHRPDAIFHVGACSDTLEARPQYMMVHNYESTKILVKWAKRSHRPFIYSSSAANYGVNGKYPSNLYGWSKYAAEDYVVSNGGCALRYFNVYGPGEEKKENMASFFYQAIIQSKNFEMPKLFPGKPRRDFIYIKDVVSANISALENYSITSGNVYDVGTGVARTFESGLEYLGLKFEYHSKSQIPIGYQNYTCANLSFRIPTWLPQFPLELGLQNYLIYLKLNGMKLN